MASSSPCTVAALARHKGLPEAFLRHGRIGLEDGPRGVRVPMREIALEGGKSSIRVYDTSGPQGHDVKAHPVGPVVEIRPR